MSVQAMVWAMERRTVTPLQKLVLIFLADRADVEGYASLKDIHDFLPATMADVRAAVAALVEQELVSYDGQLRVLSPQPAYEPRVGLLPARLRKELIAAAGGKCVACGSAERPCVDHIIPRSRGGTNDRGNLQVLCARCNTSKRNKRPEDWKGRRQNGQD